MLKRLLTRALGLRSVIELRLGKLDCTDVPVKSGYQVVPNRFVSTNLFILAKLRLPLLWSGSAVEKLL